MRTSPRSGITLIELLTVIAIISVLIAIIFPAVQSARGSARRMQCMSNLRQLGIAVHLYHDSYEALPPASLPGWPKSRAWFGEIDYASNTADVREGSLAPFFERNGRILKCPDMGSIELLYGGETGGYGYNMNLGATIYEPPSYSPTLKLKTMADFANRGTTRTIVATDAARIQLPWYGDPELKITENFYIQGPQDIQFFTAPGTQFRHFGSTANVLFLDGHVEGVTDPEAPLPTHWSEDAKTLAIRERVGYVTHHSDGDEIDGPTYTPY